MNEILTEEKIFIMIIGGVASGKSYVYEKNFKHLSLVDIDEYTKQYSSGDWNEARKYIAKAMNAAKSDLKKYFSEGTSVVNTGAGGSITGTINKFNGAKNEGFKTCIILVDVPVEKALEQNKSRAVKGDRNLIPDYKVIASNKTARENFKIYEKLTDYSLVINKENS